MRARGGSLYGIPKRVENIEQERVDQLLSETLFVMKTKSEAELTTQHRIALVQMLYRDNQTKAVLAALMRAQMPTAADRVYLTQEGYCTREPNGFHKLTPRGDYRARIYRKEFARGFGIEGVKVSRIKQDSTFQRDVWSQEGNG